MVSSVEEGYLKETMGIIVVSPYSRPELFLGCNRDLYFGSPSLTKLAKQTSLKILIMFRVVSQKAAAKLLFFK